MESDLETHYGAPGVEPTAAAARVASLARGDSVARYVILHRLGRGGMGTVYAAYDPELDRKIALKLVNPPRGEREAEVGRKRLIREAQAMARLDHPNVVTVHDAGTHGSQVFVAMEFIQGTTLSAWLRAGNRSWRDITRVFVAAGQGLAAAHDAGMVHRDFKPDNVMIANNDRVRVLDFGLVRTLEAAAPEDEAVTEPPARTDPKERIRQALAGRGKLSGRDGSNVDVEGSTAAASATGPADPTGVDPLTRTGAVMGTPAYMAPEQFAGNPTDARSDQFSFCVALFQALYGVRPFPGDTFGELAANVLDGKLRDAPTDGDIPRWIRTAVVRGLASDPANRWSSMRPLLGQLERKRARRRRWAGLLALGLGGAAVGVAALPSTPGPGCLDADPQWAGVWDARRRSEVRAGILGGGEPYAPDAWTVVERELDDYRRTWSTAYEAACRDAFVDRAVTERMHDLRVACFLRGRAQASSVIEVLAAGQATVSAADAVGGLPSAERCLDVERLSLAVAPPEDQALADKVEEQRLVLAQARGLESTGRYEDFLAAAQESVRIAAELGYQPLAAESALLAGRGLDRVGRHSQAREELMRATFLARGCGDAEAAARAEALLVYVVGFRLGQIDAANVWSRHALADLQHLGDDPEIRADVLVNTATIDAAAGRLDAAIEKTQSAVSIRETTLRAGHPALIEAVSNLGQLERAAGRYERAEATLQRALQLTQDSHGPAHPATARVLSALGEVSSRGGDLVAAGERFSEALAIREASLGPQHPDVLSSVAGLSAVAYSQGRWDDARVYESRALRLAQGVYGSDHPNVIKSLGNLAAIELGSGSLPEAIAGFEEVIDRSVRALGEQHPQTALSRARLGTALVRSGRHRAALAALEPALAILEATGAEPRDVGQACFNLAQALWETSIDRARARKLAQRAVEALESAGPPAATDLASARAWLADHPP